MCPAQILDGLLPALQFVLVDLQHADRAAAAAAVRTFRGWRQVRRRGGVGSGGLVHVRVRSGVSEWRRQPSVGDPSTLGLPARALTVAGLGCADHESKPMTILTRFILRFLALVAITVVVLSGVSVEPIRASANPAATGAAPPVVTQDGVHRS